MSVDGLRGRRLAIVAAGIAACALFALSIGGGFVYDDHRFLVDNAALSEPSILWRAFVDPVVQTSDGSHAGLWRPLRTLSFALDAVVFRGAPAGSHAVNVLLHGAGTAALAGLLLRWRSGVLAALVGALLYAAHPAQVECVAWISSRGDLLAALFLWCSLLLAADDRRAPALVAGALALLSKEQAIVWPLLAVLSDRMSGRALRQSVRRAWAPAAVTAAFLVARFSLLETPLQEGGLGPTSISDIGRMLAHQVGFALLPVGSVFDWQMPDSSPRGAGVALALVAALPLAGLAIRRTRAPAAWFLVALAPTLFVQLLVPLNIRVADRFLCFALPALAALGALSATRDRRVAPALALGVGCCALLSLSTIPAWKSDTTLWARTAAAVPGHWRAEQSLGVAAFRAGDTQRAVEHLRRAAEAGPAAAQTHYQLAWALERLGSETRDTQLFREALREYLAANALADRPRTHRPERVRLLSRVGAAYLFLALGDTAQARAALESVIGGPPPRDPDEFWATRIDEVARRVAVHLDADLARRVRQWAGRPDAGER